MREHETFLRFPFTERQYIVPIKYPNRATGVKRLISVISHQLFPLQEFVSEHHWVDICQIVALHTQHE